MQQAVQLVFEQGVVLAEGEFAGKIEDRDCSRLPALLSALLAPLSRDVTAGARGYQKQTGWGKNGRNYALSAREDTSRRVAGIASSIRTSQSDATRPKLRPVKNVGRRRE